MRTQVEDYVIKRIECYEAWEAHDPVKFPNTVQPFFISDIVVLLRYIKRLEATIESNSYRIEK